MITSLVAMTGCIDATEKFLSCGLASRPFGSTDLVPTDVTIPNCDTFGTQLSSLQKKIQNASSHAQKLVLGRTHEELTAQPKPGRWSAAECFAHLAQTTLVFLPPISSAIALAPKMVAARQLRAGTFARLLIRSLEPPYRLRHKVLAHLEPQHRDFPSAWSTFLNSQVDLMQVVQSAAGLAIDQVRIKSPVCDHVRYNVYGALEILSAHQRRHLWQVEQVFKALDRQAA